MKILISIAVHEDISVVKDTIENLLYYLQDPIVLIHSRPNLFCDVNKLVSSYNNYVYLNPTSFYTGYVDGSLFFVHYSNLKFANENNLMFDYFLPFGSNQLFIKKGIEKYISNYTCSKSVSKNKNHLYTCPHYTKFYYDSYFKNTNKIAYKAAPEGHYYNYKLTKKLLDDVSIRSIYQNLSANYLSESHQRKRLLLHKIAKYAYYFRILRFFPAKLLIYTYALEEIILPGLSKNQNKMGSTYCYINWKNNLKVTIEDVNQLRLIGNFYAVKRVDRIMNDPLRMFIRKTSNNYIK